jgi:hypothetical protein
MLAAIISLFLLLAAATGSRADDGGGNQQSADATGSDSSGAGAATDAMQIDDKNSSSASKIRQNYFKRFPFAKAADQEDTVQDQESQSGNNVSYQKALDTVTTRCDYFSGSQGQGDIHYQQQTEQGSVQTATRRDGEITKNALTTYGLPVSDSQFQVIDRENRQRLLELMFDPERWVWSELATDQLMAASAANSAGGAAQTSFKGAFDSISTVLINVANESAASPSIGGQNRSIPQAVYIVQQAYKTIFIPVALLLLLPGALMTQMKGLIGFSFLGGDDDARTPFDGVIRAVIAVFLIPATQLIVSYCIDIGNVLADSVRDPSRSWVQEGTIMNWAHEQMFVAPPSKFRNAIDVNGGGAAGSPNSSGGGSGQPVAGQAGGQSGGPAFNLNIFGNSQPGQDANQAINQFLNSVFGQFSPANVGALIAEGGGKAAGQSSDSTVEENELFLSSALQLGFNSASYLFGYALSVLSAYQLVFICYLFLLGPIAAAFFAWPSGVGKLFRKVFGNWLDAVIVLCLWRFYWCVILACMTQRVLYLQQSGNFNPHSPEEMMVFSCFLALMLYVPFQPFNFNPGEAVAAVLDKVSQGGGGGGGAGQTGPGGGSGGRKAPTESVTRRSGVATSEFAKVSIKGGSHSAISQLSASAARPGMDLADAPPTGQAGPGADSAGYSDQPENLPAALSSVQPSSAPASLPPDPAASGPSGSWTSANPGEMAGPAIDLMQPGQPPVVPLAPPAAKSERFLIRSADAGQVKASMQSWQQVLTNNPADASAAPGRVASGSAGGSPASGVAKADPQASSNPGSPAGPGSPESLPPGVSEQAARNAQPGPMPPAAGADQQRERPSTSPNAVPDKTNLAGDGANGASGIDPPPSGNRPSDDPPKTS